MLQQNCILHIMISNFNFCVILTIFSTKHITTTIIIQRIAIAPYWLTSFADIVILLFVCFCSGPATDDKYFCDCLFVVSVINLLGPGRTADIVFWGYRDQEDESCLWFDFTPMAQN